MGEIFGSQKGFFWGEWGWSFLIVIEESTLADLQKQVVKGGFNFKKLNCVLALCFYQFSKIIYFYDTDCAFTCLYRSIKFPKFEHDQRVI